MSDQFSRVELRVSAKHMLTGVTTADRFRNILTDEEKIAYDNMVPVFKTEEPHTPFGQVNKYQERVEIDDIVRW